MHILRAYLFSQFSFQLLSLIKWVQFFFFSASSDSLKACFPDLFINTRQFISFGIFIDPPLQMDDGAHNTWLKTLDKALKQVKEQVVFCNKSFESITAMIQRYTSMFQDVLSQLSILQLNQSGNNQQKDLFPVFHFCPPCHLHKPSTTNTPLPFRIPFSPLFLHNPSFQHKSSFLFHPLRTRMQCFVVTNQPQSICLNLMELTLRVGCSKLINTSKSMRFLINDALH